MVFGDGFSIECVGCGGVNVFVLDVLGVFGGWVATSRQQPRQPTGRTGGGFSWVFLRFLDRMRDDSQQHRLQAIARS